MDMSNFTKRDVAVAAGLGLATGISGGLLHRYVLSVDKGKKPLPLSAEVPAGAVPNKLEVDKATGVVTLRSAPAAAMLEQLKGYELVAVSELPTSTLYKLQKIDASKPASASAAAWIPLAAKAGWDVLIDSRLTALLDGQPVQPPKDAGPDLVVARKTVTPTLAQVGKPYALLIIGDSVPDGLLPGLPGSVPATAMAPAPATTPAGAPAAPATATDKAIEVVKSVTSGVTRVQKLVVGKTVGAATGAMTESSTKYGLMVGGGIALLTGAVLAAKHVSDKSKRRGRFMRDDSYSGIMRRARMGY